MNAPIRVSGAARTLALTLNGRAVAAEVEPRTNLADFVRDTLDATGTHIGCEHGVCGACTVLVDGEPARACLSFAAACAGAQVTTIEGLDDDAVTAELRTAFNREHALQCGFCTPGMLVSSRDLVLRLAEPDEARIRLGLAGNLCRCTGYAGIVKAVASVIADRRARGIAAGTAPRPLGPVGARAGAGTEAAAPLKTPEAVRATPAPPARAADFTPAHSFAQSFDLAFPKARVFALFADIREVAACLPGAVVDEMPDPEHVVGGMKVKLGPISTTFRGTARVTRNADTFSGVILGAGGDGRSATQGEIRYRVLDGAMPGTARVELTVGYTLKGPLAQFGRPGLVREVAGRLIADFAAHLDARLKGAPVPAATDGGLNPLRLLLSLLAQRLKALFGR
ncbi:xanthine dehydrogenase family Fe-S subunit [Xanthobacter agilis]|uniref:xanthine dehydrogenase family Fe-S subunit n=1 Tax=Xanthobacter agilis TaxID=47492 RepID=UPI003726C2BC